VVIEAVSLFGFVGPVDTVAVTLTRLHIGQQAVPHLIGVLRELDTLFVALLIEQAKFDLGGMRAEERKVGAPRLIGCTTRKGPTLTYA
jgi:hypothetical protein